MTTESIERVEQRPLEEEMRESFIDYSMSVIVQRALPDVRDGLKPVHRRILYAMHEAGLGPTRPYRKSATVVGDVIGKYHPHGDSAVYDSLVRMAQEFSLRYPLVDGQGNFGSVDGDSAAAYRYTEARLAGFASELLGDIDKDTVDHTPNFDDRLQEPTVLPSALPNLLVNGSSGIAVGMATNIPPHNLREVAAACHRLIEAPDTTLDELMEIVRGPDFPTGGTIFGGAGIREAYRQGRGRVVMRAKADIEEGRDGRDRIIIREIPFMVNKTRLIEQIAGLVRDKKVTDISDLRDESDRDGIRVVIELKRDAVPQIVLNQLFKGTQLQSTFGVIMLALVNGEPQVMDLKTMLGHFLEHRHEVVERRTRFEYGVAKDREHVLEGLKVAVDNIDEVIRIIRASSETEIASAELRSAFDLSERQADAILNMRLARLTGLEIEKLEEELEKVRARRQELEAILASRGRRMEIVGDELSALVDKFGDERRTEIVPDTSDLTDEDLIAEERMVITVSHSGYIKRIEPQVYRAQRRGGRGIAGMGTKEEDWVEHLFLASTHDYLLIFTRDGRLYRLKVYQIPPARRTARGKPIVNLLRMNKGDEVASIVRVREFSDDRFLIFASRRGLVKRTSLAAYRNVHAGGLRAINIREDDRLIDVKLSDGSNDVLLATRRGMAIRFSESDAREMGRPAQGVRGIRLSDDDTVVGLVVARRGGSLLTASELGMGKRSDVDDYRIQKRGGKGLINLKPTEKSGLVAAVREVTDEDELMFVTRNGVINRQRAEEIRVIGRNTQGVRLVSLDEGDELVDVAGMIDPVGTDEGEENPETDATARAEGGSEPSGGDGAEAGDTE
ncbi:MAG: DNA gyrase subunit A [Gemmatimonadota bacterium]|uniref:DNA gyrase subunit A n=1 Tax=Candidatus Palauibacter scopulicola TaxID=3056741 RepID=UPI00238C0C34|nr:DNA gyrase subunit A [Candidatus Palauibacter scopulicola]MDE2662626.1 DNA gyrase subunit A [Candidatus Palauibacter scopulicola]